MKRGKKYKQTTKIATSATLTLEEGLELVKKLSYSNFDGSIELHLNLKLPKDKDPKSIKGQLVLPHSTEDKKDLNIIVFTNDAEAAIKAGATEAGLDELIKKVKEGSIQYDVVLATPEVMGKIAILGKELGPKGLMPNPKTGTVTTDIQKTIEEFKKGKKVFKCDKDGNIHVAVGKVSMEVKDVVENIQATLEAIEKTVDKPVETMLKSAYLAPTMGKSVKVQL